MKEEPEEQTVEPVVAAMGNEVAEVVPEVPTLATLVEESKTTKKKLHQLGSVITVVRKC